MSKVAQIERDIESLSRAEFAELRDWILEKDWESWDAQVERDGRARKLDELIRESEQDYETGRNGDL